jgi:hypothetical protein
MADPERRDPAQPDRRRFPTRTIQGGRRITDADPSHGTRARYRHGCRCLPCKAANARALTDWRRARKAGRVPLGALVPAVEAHRIIKVLRAEWQTKAALARDLGRHHDLARLSQQDMITVRMLLRIRYLYRVRMLEPGPDGAASS